MMSEREKTAIDAAKESVGFWWDACKAHDMDEAALMESQTMMFAAIAAAEAAIRQADAMEEIARLLSGAAKAGEGSLP